MAAGTTSQAGADCARLGRSSAYALVGGRTGARAGGEQFPPGRPWVQVYYHNDGARVAVRLLNDAQAPTYPAGTRLAGVEVRASDALAPGYYLVCDRRFAGIEYVGRLLAEDIEADRLAFSFDGCLPEPVVCSIRRGRTPKVRLYRLAAPGALHTAAGNSQSC